MHGGSDKVREESTGPEAVEEANEISLLAELTWKVLWRAAAGALAVCPLQQLKELLPRVKIGWSCLTTQAEVKSQKRGILHLLKFFKSFWSFACLCCRPFAVVYLTQVVMGRGLSSLKPFGLSETNVVWMYVPAPFFFCLFWPVTMLRVCVCVTQSSGGLHGAQRAAGVCIFGGTNSWMAKGPSNMGLCWEVGGQGPLEFFPYSQSYCMNLIPFHDNESMKAMV